MAEDRSEGSDSNTNKNDQFASQDDYAPKVRKPYTITKQRERWTEEEHKKFLEALKLYGRAWRRIEEHVGSKTAVQIRSHAQKFFSKVVRESTSGDVAEVKPIEIPPPRPKRKPMHPYPRKHSTPIKTGGQHARSTSPNSSGSDQENQSPTSVLSAGGSNAFGLGDSGSPNTEENTSSPPMKMESCCEEKDGGSTQCLKLFGKTVVITDGNNNSNNNNNNNNSSMPVNSLPCGAPVYYMQFLDENMESTVVRSSPSVWGVYGHVSSYPLGQPCNNAVNVEGSSDSESVGGKDEEDEDVKEEKKRPFLLIGSERSAFTKQNSKKRDTCMKGFVPYKRCVEEREEQRIRLCL
ncbi:hypothetical protein LXL04_024820 [Taraxacum kok-saghyz]